jgi:hypothetical protein
MTSRHLGLVVLAALLLPACGSTPTTPTDIPRAALLVTVDPTPVPPSQNTLTGAVSIGYKIVITETAGLGGTMQFVSSQIFNPANGQLLSLTYFDGDDLIVFVGKKRIDPGGTMIVPQTGTYTLPDLSKNATLVVNVQMLDDRDNIINSSVLVKIE